MKLAGVALVAVAATGVDAGCPFALRFPTNNGACNNVRDEFLGAKGTQYNKFGTTPRLTKFSDFGRANARVISNVVFQHPPGDLPDQRGLTHFCMQWGQFMDHDVTLTPVPVEVREDVPVLDHESELRFKTDARAGRKIAFTRAKGFDKDEMQNDITHWIDASTVYGSDDDQLALLLEEGTAKLKVDASGNIPKNPTTGEALAGDTRADVQPGLSSVHTLFVREHNRLVDIITKDGLSSNVEWTFQLARLIVQSEIQRITWDQWLPALLGGRIEELPYNQTHNPGVHRAFAGAIFRTGHSLIMEHFDLYDHTKFNATSRTYTEIKPPFILKDAFHHDQLRLERIGGQIEPVLIGLFTQPAEKMDNFIIDSMRNNLFVKQFNFGANFTEALDIVTINIQRGRDLSLNDFRTFKAQVEGVVINKWSDLTKNIDLRRRLRTLYDNKLDNIDMFVGILTEDHVGGVPGTSMPPTLRSAWINQWGQLQRADRLWFRTHLPKVMPLLCANPKATRICAVMDGLMKGTWGLADVIRANTKIPFVPDNPFVRPGFERFHTNLPIIKQIERKPDVRIPTYNPAEDEEDASIAIASSNDEVEDDTTDLPAGDTCGEATCSFFGFCNRGATSAACGCFSGFRPAAEDDTSTCTQCRNLMRNGNFELPRLNQGAAGSRNWALVGPDIVPGWQTTDSAFEIWTNTTSANISVFGGNQMIELAALRRRASVYQVLDTNPGDNLVLRFSHRGREGEDTLRVHAGTHDDLKVLGEFKTGTTWRRYEIKYTVPDEQTSTRFVFQGSASTTPACGDRADCRIARGNFLDAVTLMPEGC